jgi:hypothetical protein
MPATHSPLEPPTPGFRAAVLWGHCLLTGGCALFGLTWQAGMFGLSVEDMTYAAAVALLLLFGWSLWSWVVLTRSWFDPYSLFLVAANLFNAGQAFLEVFRLNPSGMLPDLFPERTILDSLFLVFLGLSAMHLGALLSITVVARSPDRATRVIGGPRLFWSSYCLLYAVYCLLLRAVYCLLLVRGCWTASSRGAGCPAGGRDAPLRRWGVGGRPRRATGADRRPGGEQGSCPRRTSC